MVKLITIQILTVIAATFAVATAATIQLDTLESESTRFIEIGSGYFNPLNDPYSAAYKHGTNLRFSYTQRFSGDLLLGGILRISRKAHKYAGSVSHQTVLIGVSGGGEILSGGKRDLIPRAHIYLVRASISGGEAMSETGIGFGFSVSYLIRSSPRFGFGLEAEFNHTFLDTGLINNQGNLGGLWIAPIVRITF